MVFACGLTRTETAKVNKLFLGVSLPETDIYGPLIIECGCGMFAVRF